MGMPMPWGVERMIGVKRLAPRARWIAGLAAVMIAAIPHACAGAFYPLDEISGHPLLTSPAAVAAGAAATSSISTPPPASAAAPEGPARGLARSWGEGARAAGPAWVSRLARKSQGAGPDSWWLGLGGMALALAICGALGIIARRFAPRVAHGAIQVVGRVSLSPKHTVCLLRVGQRVLLVGTGPQGAPALLGEFDQLAELSPRLEEGDEP